MYYAKINRCGVLKMIHFNEIYKLNSIHRLKIICLRTHSWLSSEIKSAISDSYKDKHYLNLLFVVYIFCLAALFFTEKNPADWNYDPAHKLYIYLLMPLAFMPFKFSAYSIFNVSIHLPSRFSLYNVFRNFYVCRTPFFACVLVFTVSQAAVTYILDPHPLYFYIFFYYFLAPLLTFIMITIRLCVDYPCFYYNFYRWSGPLIATSAGINLFYYFNSLPDFASIGTNRIGSIYGFVFGNNPNVDGIIYTNFLVGSLLTLLKNHTKFDLFMLLPPNFLLAVTVLLEQTRGELLGILIAFLALFSLNFDKIKLANFYPFFISTASLLTFTQLFIPGGIITYFKRADSNRFIVWQEAFVYIKAAPFFGQGLKNNLSIVTPGETFMHAHSILIGAQIRSGLIGSVSLILAYILGIVQSYRYAMKTSNSIPLCIFIVFTISSMFDHELKIGQAGWEWIAFWIPISFAMGSDAFIKQSERNNEKIDSNK